MKVAQIKVLRGNAPNLFEYAWEIAHKKVTNNPDLYIVPDLESGYPQVMTIEQRDKLIQIWEAAKPKVYRTSVCNIIVFGTSSNIE